MPHLSEAQIQEARNIDLLDYLHRYEPNSVVKIDNNEYCLKAHDSFKLSNGKWYWWSRGFGGYSALDYLVKVRGVGFVDAVLSLTGGVAHGSEHGGYGRAGVDVYDRTKPIASLHPINKKLSDSHLHKASNPPSAPKSPKPSSSKPKPFTLPKPHTKRQQHQRQQQPITKQHPNIRT